MILAPGRLWNCCARGESTAVDVACILPPPRTAILFVKVRLAETDSSVGDFSEACPERSRRDACPDMFEAYLRSASWSASPAFISVT
jgi:hypothetical protein